MQVNDKLTGLYDTYYLQGSPLFLKRSIAARQTVGHVLELLPDAPYANVLDIGAGEGSLLAALSEKRFAEVLHAVEISDSGVEAIGRRSIPNLRSVERFDGYTIKAATDTYTVGTAVHVLEHVEHERLFLAEIARACRLVYVEVPLELTLRVERAIRASSPYGHLNFYTASTFRNLLETAGLEILGFKVFSNSLAYETHVGGKARGMVKYLLRNGLLSVAPGLAGFAMSYLAGAVCRRRT
jgi:Methyltransferase domain